MNENQEQKAWRDVKYGRRFLNAFRGMYIVLKTTRHIFIHLVSALLVVAAGFYFDVAALEWVALVFAIGMVFTAEAFNTAIEIDIDLTSPDFHPYARDTKDAAAAAVLLSAFTALSVGLIIFLPKIFKLLS